MAPGVQVDRRRTPLPEFSVSSPCQDLLGSTCEALTDTGMTREVPDQERACGQIIWSAEVRWDRFSGCHKLVSA